MQSQAPRSPCHPKALQHLPDVPLAGLAHPGRAQDRPAVEPV